MSKLRRVWQTWLVFLMAYIVIATCLAACPLRSLATQGLALNSPETPRHTSVADGGTTAASTTHPNQDVSLYLSAGNGSPSQWVPSGTLYAMVATLTNASTGDPIAGVPISVETSLDDMIQPNSTIPTGSDGSAHFSIITPTAVTPVRDEIMASATYAKQPVSAFANVTVSIEPFYYTMHLSRTSLGAGPVTSGDQFSLVSVLLYEGNIVSNVYMEIVGNIGQVLGEGFVSETGNLSVTVTAPAVYQNTSLTFTSTALELGLIVGQSTVAVPIVRAPAWTPTIAQWAEGNSTIVLGLATGIIAIASPLVAPLVLPRPAIVYGRIPSRNRRPDRRMPQSSDIQEHGSSELAGIAIWNRGSRPAFSASDTGRFGLAVETIPDFPSSLRPIPGSSSDIGRFERDRFRLGGGFWLGFNVWLPGAGVTLRQSVESEPPGKFVVRDTLGPDRRVREVTIVSRRRYWGLVLAPVLAYVTLAGLTIEYELLPTAVGSAAEAAGLFVLGTIATVAFFSTFVVARNRGYLPRSGLDHSDWRPD